MALAPMPPAGTVPGPAADAARRVHEPVPATCALYLHIPFCARKCAYCDFNTYAGLEALIPAYVEALRAELRLRGAQAAGRTVTTVFVGGGTPTLLDGAQLASILATVREAFDVHPGAEITCEANPGTVDRERFEALRAAGANRLSLGAQSFRPDELRWLERIHGADDVARALDAARWAGFDNVNLDLMFGLPGQPLAAWDASLTRALDLRPEHLSLYGLIVEPGTPLHRRVASGAQAPPDDDVAAAHWEHAMARLAAAGFRHYEVSNWARDDRPAPAGSIDALDPDASGDRVPALASRHNLVYWRSGDWLAAGAGAHGRWRAHDATAPSGYVDRRWSNARGVAAYVERIGRGEGSGPVEAEAEAVDARTAMGEAMMLGLRLVDEGVVHARFERRHGVDPREAFGAELAALEDEGLVSVDAARIRTTPLGLALGNRVAERFIATR